MHSLPRIQFDFFVNPSADHGERYGTSRAAILSEHALDLAKADITAWPGYAATPMRAFPELAAALDVATIHYKDEGSRFGLGSFKALGGAYAVGKLLCVELRRILGREIVMRDLFCEDVRRACAGITVTCATDGNHGRSVAWGAQLFDCGCVIYIHATVSMGRARAIEKFGARVIRTEGNYDDAVRRAARDAAAQGWFVISDTSYPGYMDVPRDVMQGYQLMVDEAASQIEAWPTHVFVQAGVGGFAAAVCAYFWERNASFRPFFCVVEPTKADCLMQSAKSGQPTAVTGDLDTIMAGLACGEVSLLAWEILAHGADAFCTVDDAAAVATMRLLANPLGSDPVVVAGESAVAGLAAAIGLARDPDARRALGIERDSRLLFFGSEADTDPALYQQLVGANDAGRHLP
ncbi:MAG: diaminopropionate ammonia-lyase [Thiomonas sp.]